MDLQAATRQAVLAVTYPALPLIGKVQLPLRRLMDENDAQQFMNSKPKVGTSLISRKRAQLSNLGIPGWWKHMAIYVGFIGDLPMIVEAVWPWVRMVPVERWFCGEDYARAKVPLFMTDDQMSRKAGKALHVLGLPYDRRMQLTVGCMREHLIANGGDRDEVKESHPAFYCSETDWWATNEVFKEDRLPNPWAPKMEMDILTVLADDCDHDPKMWSTWWESDTAKAVLTR